MSNATMAIDPATMSMVASGDRAAFASFYDFLAPRVLGVITRVLRDPFQSEEVTQEVFLEIWQTATRFDAAKGNPISWTMTIAHRRAIDRVRAAQASRTRDLKIGIRDYAVAHDSVAEAGEMSLERVRIAKAMSTLTPRQHEAISLSYYDGLSHGEIAAQLGIPMGTVKTRMRDGMLKLRKAMEQE
jgi:RNA polymerase sigma-70 factor (ECF subfamily)